MDKYITATEINQFTYCPYQWYYEKKYGRNELTRLLKERNAGHTDNYARADKFHRGREFHELYHKKYNSRLTAGFLFPFFAVLILLVITWFLINSGMITFGVGSV